ncbi:MAG: hypothetical protein KAS32_21245, partial [Candidatus Peribacteraceae bacterium]|nr:hypothetical protein [Candidatus Peribacteraceae bacterium]
MERFTKFSNGLRDKNIPIKVQQVDSKGKVVNQSGSVIMGGGDTGFYKPETSTLGDFIAQNMTLISSTGGTFTKNDLSVQEYDENETSTGFRGSMMMGEVATGNRAETVKMDQNDNVKVNVQAITGVPKFTVENALTSTGFDLNAAPYSQTTNITEDYLLNNLRLEFTTTESKTITVTSANGTKLWERTTTALDVSVPFDNAMDATDEVTVAVTQTAGACSMDLTLTIKKGDVTVGDNAVLGAGNNLIGTVRDFLIEVGRGTIPNNGSMLKFGENPDIDTGGFEDIWDAGGTYVPPTQARVHDVVSSTGSDAGVVTSSGTATAAGSIVLTDTGATFISDGVNVGDAVLDDTDMEIGQVTAVTSETELAIAGGMRSPMDGAFGAGFTVGDNYRVVTNSSTGASIFYIEGLDASFLEQDEFVVLDGTTPVSTVGSYIRQFRARVFGRGTTGAIGTITSTAQVDGTISCQVIDGNNQTLMAIYTVPANKKGYLLKWWGSLSKKQGAVSNMRLRIGTLGAIGYLVQTRAVDNGGSSEFVYERTVPSLLPAGIDIWVEADTDTNNTGVSSGFDILLVEST